MSDIRLIWDAAQGGCDWLLAPGDLATGDDLQTAVLVSLFTDRAAPSEAVPPGEDRRGWWADAYADRPIGSQLWRLDRATRTSATLRAAEDYAREALAWLVEDGVAGSVAVTASWVGRALGLRVALVRSAGGAAIYDFAWEIS